MAANMPTLSSDSMLLLEQSLLRVPVESMRKTSRTASKTADKEINAIETSLKKVKTTAGGAGKREDKLKAIEMSLKKLDSVKNKVRFRVILVTRADRSTATADPTFADERIIPRPPKLMNVIPLVCVQLQDCHAAQKSLVESSRTRINHIQQLESLSSFDSRAYITWAHIRLQRHLVDYLLRRGYAESAQALAKDEHLDGLSDVDIDLFKDLQRIEDALRSGSATEALIWCKDNSSTLKKGKVRFTAFRLPTL